MSRTRVSPMVVGAALAVLTVIVVGVVLGMQSVTGGSHSAELPANASVLLIVVSPDASGVNLPVSLTLRSASASAPGSESVDPGMPATVSGTSARTLGAAYPFGGGRAVASALGAARGVAPPHWVVLDARTMAGLGSPGPVSVDLPRPVDVFDGVNLYSFPAGAAAVPTEQLGLLMTGVSGWTVAERAAVRRQIEIEIWRRLTSPGARLDTVRTDLTTDQVRLWVQQARS